jgi:hypothetical protein
MTLYVYTNDVPVADNNPSVDQPSMTVNTASIDGIIATDHVGFNTNGPIGPPYGGGGQHLQVTFNGNNVPAVQPTGPQAGNYYPPELFTNQVGSLPQLFYYSGSPTQSASQYVNSSNGSTMCLGGIIIKWGVFALTNTISTPISFATAFPNACYSIVVSNTSGLATDVVGVLLPFGTSQFNAKRSFTGGPSNYSYIAIGW